MSYQNTSCIKSFKAAAAIAPFTIVKFDAAADTVTPAAASTDVLLGVANEMGIDANDIAKGAMVDVILGEIAQVKLGGTVTQGQRLTSNATGQAVAAAPAAGANASIIGIAFKSGVAGDVIPVLIEQSVMQG